MLLFNTKVLAKAARKHRDAATAIEEWAELVTANDWKNLTGLRQAFATADGVPVKGIGGAVIVATVFNVKGNTYRLITVVDYAMRTIDLREFMTHAEYSKDNWKDRL